MSSQKQSLKPAAGPRRLSGRRSQKQREVRPGGKEVRPRQVPTAASVGVRSRWGPLGDDKGPSSGFSLPK